MSCEKPLTQSMSNSNSISAHLINCGLKTEIKQCHGHSVMDSKASGDTKQCHFAIRFSKIITFSQRPQTSFTGDRMADDVKEWKELGF